MTWYPQAGDAEKQWYSLRIWGARSLNASPKSEKMRGDFQTQAWSHKAEGAIPLFYIYHLSFSVNVSEIDIFPIIFFYNGPIPLPK